jgi:hypothetical protein
VVEALGKWKVDEEEAQKEKCEMNFNHFVFGFVTLN